MPDSVSSQLEPAETRTPRPMVAGVVVGFPAFTGLAK
jgi:hypothetical protein